MGKNRYCKDNLKDIKRQAICMRNQSATYNEINRLLGVPKGTLRGWFKKAEASGKLRSRLLTGNQMKWAQNIITYNKKRALVAREKAEDIRRQAADKVAKLSDRDLALVGIALYWAEGDKRSRWRLDFSNSEPAAIRLMMKFFREICEVPEEKFKPWVQIHQNISAKKAIGFWSKITNIPPDRFTIQNQTSKSSKSKRPGDRLPYGTLHIRIHGGELANRVKGWVEGLARQV